jgi:hypothetical protein
MFGFDDSAFKKALGTILVALLVTGFLPIINLVRLIPLFKEVVLGTVVVVVFTSIRDTKQGIKFALVTGMLAALVFNIVYIPTSFILGGAIGAASGSGEQAGRMAMMQGIGAAANLIGFVLFSPFGYAIGGALGSVLND